MSLSTHSTILNAIRDVIKTLNLEGIDSANVRRIHLGKVDAAIKAGSLKIPAVIVSTVIGAEKIGVATNMDDDVGYPTTVAIIAPGTYLATEEEEDRYLLWRQQIRVAFQGQALRNTGNVWKSEIEPANINSLQAWVGSDLHVSGMIVRATSRDRVRG